MSVSRSTCLCLCLCLICTVFCLPVHAASQTSQSVKWCESWQHTLADWMASLDESQLATSVKSIDVTKLDPSDDRRNMAMVMGYSPPLTIATDIINLPTNAFLWQDGIWKPDLAAEQWNIKHKLAQGQIWLPTHPTGGCLLAWLYKADQAWNPYYKDQNLARRAAVIAMVELIMEREAIFWLNDPQSPRPASSPNVHTGSFGFVLSFNAFTYANIKDVLPRNVQQAWEEGMSFIIRKLASSPPTGPENMRLSVPVGMYYAYLGTGQQWILDEAKKQTKTLVYDTFDQSGYYPDGGVPDGSYNGISLHRVSELYSITKWPHVKEILNKAYRLKRHLTLIEPDGSWISPSHFNLRCKDSFANDQYSGREVQIALDVPEAAPFLRRYWQGQYTHQGVVSRIERFSKGTSGKAQTPGSWGMHGKRPFDWAPLLNLPYVIYQQDEGKLEQLVQFGLALPLEEEDKVFAENFGNEFYCIRTPSYNVILYAGPGTPFDNGMTNQHSMLGGEGGYFNGFAGGGISAFWTPKAGSLLLGRMTACEAYERGSKTFKWGTYNLGGWQDWANNHIIGKLTNGKILTSARTKSPDSQFNKDAKTLCITGVMPTMFKKQGSITDATVNYQRDYKFNDEAIQCTVQVTSNQTLDFESLYETLPMNLSFDTKVSLVDMHSRAIEMGNEIYAGIDHVILQRKDAGIKIQFFKPVTIAMTSIPLLSKQHSSALVRAMHIDLGKQLESGKTTTMQYQITPME